MLRQTLSTKYSQGLSERPGSTTPGNAHSELQSQALEGRAPLVKDLFDCTVYARILKSKVNIEN